MWYVSLLAIREQHACVDTRCPAEQSDVMLYGRTRRAKLLLPTQIKSCATHVFGRRPVFGNQWSKLLIWVEFCDRIIDTEQWAYYEVCPCFLSVFLAKAGICRDYIELAASAAHSLLWFFFFQAHFEYGFSALSQHHFVYFLCLWSLCLFLNSFCLKLFSSILSVYIISSVILYEISPYSLHSIEPWALLNVYSFGCCSRQY